MDIKKISLFALSAGSTALIYIGLLYVFVEIVQAHIVVSITISYFSAMAFYFLTNKLLVFRDTSKKELPRQITQFVIVMIINYLISLGIISGIRSLTGEVYSGSALAGLFTTALAYFVFDRFLFAAHQ